MTLHTEGLVMLTGVDTAVATRSALVAVSVRIAGHDHARLQDFWHFTTNGLYDGTYLMTRDDRIESHAIATHEGIEI